MASVMSWRAMVLAAAAALLAACGGSGGSPTDPGGASVAQVEAQSFALVNQARQAEGVQPQLVHDPRLDDVARAYSEAMRDRGFFSHIDPEGHDFVFRLQQGGIGFRAAGENLARVMNASDPAAFAHQLFLENPEHRGNILDPRLTHGGVGVAREGRTYWITQLYIRR
jgi:uncharacterized protein YkwD